MGKKEDEERRTAVVGRRHRGHLRPYRQGGRGGTPEFLTTDEKDSFFLSFPFSFLSFDPESRDLYMIF